ncbi:Kinesin light chain [Hondaea fermentalgiana]|uniref:Kinesin light chain n=1 Tax=Hondaea fermentalgiana TaxID=2315210 RepID=A0A2R5GWW2_9STRA|nr:Kinesin light chain [Hondaea fermentalgiana]|eukprot:GBG35065.1 Kinesin light chain [Hondaea fermentalgiana]
MRRARFVYDSHGRYEEALAYYEEALSRGKGSLGDRHPDVATTLNNIALVYASQGRYEKALAYGGFASTAASRRPRIAGHTKCTPLPPTDRGCWEMEMT